MQRRNVLERLRVSLHLVFLAGCPGGSGASATEPMVTTDGTETTESAGDTTTGDTGDTATGETEGTGGLLVECPTPITPGNFGFFGDDEAFVVNFTEVCSASDFPALYDRYMTGKFSVGVYRPDDQRGWPAQDLPLLIFAHGNGHRYYGYDGLFSELARLGFVVVSLDFPDHLNVQTRGEQMLCASRWFASDWAESDRLNGSLVFAGHSRGGEAVAYATGRREELASELDVFDLQASLSLAPSKFFSFMLSNTSSPFLLLQGATDEDTTSGVIKLYEGLGLEEDLLPGSPGKWVVWIYDVAHSDYGGRCFAAPPEKQCTSTPKGLAVVRNFFSSFLQWHIFGQQSYRQYFVGSDSVLPESPDLLINMDFWTEWGKPRVFRAFVEDSEALSGERQVLDAFEDGNLQTSTANGTVQIAGGPAVSVEGSAIQDVTNTEHNTGVLYLRWAPGELPVVRWSVPAPFRESIVDFSHFQFRIANVINSIGPILKCELDSNPPPSFEIAFIDGDDNVFTDSSISAGEIPVQDVRLVTSPVESCEGTNFLRTLRLRLDRLCVEGLVLSELVAIEFRLGGSAPGHLMIDSLEFTRSPFDDPGACGSPLTCVNKSP